MTDNEYAAKVYCSVFCTADDNGDTYTRGVLDMLGMLCSREQTALDCYIRQGKTFKQTATALGDIAGESARRIVYKALSKLRHPSKLKNLSVKLLLEDRDKKLIEAAHEIDELYDQIGLLASGTPVIPKIQSALESRKKSIVEIGFSSRVYNHLLDAGINTVEALLALDSLDILTHRRSFGKASKHEIVQKMRQSEYTQWADKMEA
ncbi:MAG: hypothetical protein FWE83_05700 [Oscillospiraceae bacterium]|nr:hypothetical protein [Oscillospiraceae bacterium]